MSAKIGFLCGSKSWGGLEMNHLQHCLWMKQQGFNVQLLCRENTPLAAQAIQADISSVYLPEYRRYKYFFAGIQLKNILKQEKITHLLVRNANDLNVCAIAKRFSSAKINLSYFMEMQLGVSKRNFLHTARFKQIDTWVCPLPYLKKQVLTQTRFPENRIQIIPSALHIQKVCSQMPKETARKLLGINHHHFLLGLIGRIDVLKGQQLLIEALHLLNDPEISVCIMGEPTRNESDLYFQHLQLSIQNYKLEKQVSIIAFHKDVRIFYAAIDACVMASKSETFGMVSVEALANGLPVIGSKAGGTTEILANGCFGLLFESQNASDLAAQIKKLKQNPRLFDSELLKKAAQKYEHQQIYQRIVREVLYLV